MNRDRLHRASERVIRALKKLEPLFVDAKLTLIVRNTNPAIEDADVIVSAEADNLAAVANVLMEHAHRNAPYVCPGCHAVAPERCAPGCIDAEIEAERERESDGSYERDDDRADDNEDTNDA